MDLKAVVAGKGNRDKNEKSPHNSAKKKKEWVDISNKKVTLLQVSPTTTTQHPLD
ncbi:MAG: hypothetical protein ACTTH6_04710 [Candidatus Altimarinota bacterium]